MEKRKLNLVYWLAATNRHAHKQGIPEIRRVPQINCYSSFV